MPCSYWDILGIRWKLMGPHNANIKWLKSPAHLSENSHPGVSSTVLQYFFQPNQSPASEVYHTWWLSTTTEKPRGINNISLFHLYLSGNVIPQGNQSGFSARLRQTYSLVDMDEEQVYLNVTALILGIWWSIVDNLDVFLNMWSYTTLVHSKRSFLW